MALKTFLYHGNYGFTQILTVIFGAGIVLLSPLPKPLDDPSVSNLSSDWWTKLNYLISRGFISPVENLLSWRISMRNWSIPPVGLTLLS